ncbi:MAG: membrane protein insertase YidC [Bacteroidales bacterium]|nr:membrane protein insertase YidC [Bacteroidales bacterium]
MNKSTSIGFFLIALIILGFSLFQSRMYNEQAMLQAQMDSLAAAQGTTSYLSDSTVMRDKAMELIREELLPSASIYQDSLLDAANAAAEEMVVLQNDKVELTFTTRGAKPYSARLKDYKTYEQTDLQVFNPGTCKYDITIYAGQVISTADFTFQVAEHTDSTVIMRLPFSQGGYIEQKYVLKEGEYAVQNLLSFVGMQGVIPRNVNSFDLDFSVVVPRMEKGYRNEAQYSKVNYRHEGEKPEKFGNGKSGSKRVDSRFSWVAFQQQFFSSIIRAPQEFASGNMDVSFFPESDESHNLMACDAQMRCDFKSAEKVEIPFEFYFGPNHYQTLKTYGQSYEKIITVGGWLVAWFTRYVIIPLFNFFHRFIGNYGLIILLMTIVIKIVVLPFTNKSYLSSAKMAAIKPEIEKLNAKYPKQEDALKKQQAQMELYKKAGISPMGGCLPTLLTFPILWAMFRFFPASIELRQQPFLWCQDLSAYDSIIDYGVRIPILGDHLSLFALLMAATMFFYSKMTMSSQTASNDPTAQSMQFMSVWMMPIMMFFICNNLSAALSYYYLLSNLFMMLQNWILRKFVVKPEAILAKVRAADSKPAKKSKWQQRLEEAQKMQQEMQRQQQKNQRR